MKIKQLFNNLLSSARMLSQPALALGPDFQALHPLAPGLAIAAADAASVQGPLGGLKQAVKAARASFARYQSDPELAALEQALSRLGPLKLRRLSFKLSKLTESLGQLAPHAPADRAFFEKHLQPKLLKVCLQRFLQPHASKHWLRDSQQILLQVRALWDLYAELRASTLKMPAQALRPKVLELDSQAESLAQFLVSWWQHLDHLGPKPKNGPALQIWYRDFKTLEQFVAAQLMPDVPSPQVLALDRRLVGFYAHAWDHLQLIPNKIERFIQSHLPPGLQFNSLLLGIIPMVNWRVIFFDVLINNFSRHFADPWRTLAWPINYALETFITLFKSSNDVPHRLLQGSATGLGLGAGLYFFKALVLNLCLMPLTLTPWVLGLGALYATLTLAMAAAWSAKQLAESLAIRLTGVPYPDLYQANVPMLNAHLEPDSALRFCEFGRQVHALLLLYRTEQVGDAPKLLDVWLDFWQHYRKAPHEFAQRWPVIQHRLQSFQREVALAEFSPAYTVLIRQMNIRASDLTQAFSQASSHGLDARIRDLSQYQVGLQSAKTPSKTHLAHVLHYCQLKHETRKVKQLYRVQTALSTWQEDPQAGKPSL